MRNRFAKLIMTLLLGFALCGGASATDWWASDVVSYSGLGNAPYDDPLAVLGKPSTWVSGSGPGQTDPCAVSVVCPAWNVGLQGEKLVTTIKPAGWITVEFATPIYDDPENWHGGDFIIFGNGCFGANGAYLSSTTNMEGVVMSVNPLFWEPSPVSVSQDGVTWYSYVDGPYADDYAPTQAFAWDWVENCWLRDSAGQEVELDFTRPVDPGLSVTDLDGKNVTQGIDMYRGSAGGTAFDLADLSDLPEDPVTGLKWAQFIRVDGTGGEVDAFARVSHEITPISIGEAKKLPDGAHVVLGEVIVQAGTYETGRFCYVEQDGRSAGIRVLGRVLERDKKVVICGDLDTIDGERVILATSVTSDDGPTVTVKPFGMLGRSIGGAGLGTTGLVVKTWGTVQSVDPVSKSFVIDDGSGRPVTCVAPRQIPEPGDPANPGNPDWGTAASAGFTPPEQEHFVTVTGISSMQPDGQGGFMPVIRLRDCDSVAAP